MTTCGTTTCTANADNELTSRSAYTLNYDSNGNLTSGLPEQTFSGAIYNGCRGEYDELLLTLAKGRR